MIRSPRMDDEIIYSWCFNDVEYFDSTPSTAIIILDKDLESFSSMISQHYIYYIHYIYGKYKYASTCHFRAMQALVHVHVALPRRIHVYTRENHPLFVIFLIVREGYPERERKPKEEGG